MMMNMNMKQQQQQRGGGGPSLENHNDDFDGGGDDDDHNAIEIAPLIPTRGGGGVTFFQRSTSSIMSNTISAGMTTSTTPPTSLGLPVRLLSSSSSLERQSPENNNNSSGRQQERLLCSWIICCCSSSNITTADDAVVAVVSEEFILLFQAIGAFCFTLLGWYIPRFLITRASTDIIKKLSIPYQTTAAGDVILDSLLNQPYVEPPTIPSQLLLLSSIWIPLVLVLITAAAWSSNNNTTLPTTNTSTKTKRLVVLPMLTIQLLHNVQAAFGGFCTAIGLSEGMTQMLKLYMQRKRPNFYALCAFDKMEKICKAEPSRILEANYSCPSGHSSLSACGMTFLALHVVGKIISLTPLSSTPVRNGSIPGLCVCSRLTAIVSQRKQCSCLLVVILTSSWAMFVGASRIVDQWHHPSDVVAGLVLGCFCALIAYHVWFPPIWFMVQLPANYSHTTNANSSSSNNGTWTPVAGIPWSLIATATNDAAVGTKGNTASALPLVDGKLPSFHE